MREEAQCVIIGGGAMGAGLLYHLAHEGWTDTILVEKGELTSGSTWHAAGLIPNFNGSLTTAKVHEEAVRLYQRLEAETGLDPGWHGVGAVRLAMTDNEVDWFRYVHTMLETLQIESHLISPAEALDLAPMFNFDGAKLCFYTPNDGWADPTGTTQAMARGARQLGAEVSKNNRVTDMNQLADGRWEVITEKGRIVCDHVVNAAGHYAPQLGEMIGLDVPIISVIHQYLVTEGMPTMKALGREIPVIRDPYSSTYYRTELDGMIIGPYEQAGAQTYGIDGIDWALDFYLTPPDLDVIAPWLERAAERVPEFAETGIRTVVSGPITHTPDSGFLCGPAPGLRNYWHCSGASIGITQGPGAGKYLAQWMVHGQTEVNPRELDPRRFGDHCAPKASYTKEKILEEFHDMYVCRAPGEQRFDGRPLKTTPLYEPFDALGAQWQEVFGWERPQYFGPPEKHTFRRSNAFDHVAAEVHGVRSGLGIADLTAFAKFEVTGPHAGALLDRLAANRIPAQPGGMRLVHMLTELGGIEGEMTITRLADDRFYLNSAIMGELHDLDWLNNGIAEGEDVTVTDVTNDRGILAVTGPRSRDALQRVTDADLTNEAFRWLTGKEIDVAGVSCIALRVSYVGELGWELHCPLDQLGELYEAIAEAAGRDTITHFGSYAMNVMRLEKAYKSWGGELTTEITPVEADILRFVNFDSDFVGKAATLARRDQSEPLTMVLVYCEVDVIDADCRGNEATYEGNRLMGITTGGAYGHTVGKSLAFAYVEPDFRQPGSTFDIDILGERCRATVLAEPAYDPNNTAIRA